MRRISKIEYRNAIKSIFSAEIFERVQDAFTWIPDEKAKGLYPSFDNQTTQRHIEGYFAVAKEIRNALTWDMKELSKFVSPCVKPTIMVIRPRCVQTVVHRFGSRVIGRPLLPAEVEEISEQYYISPPEIEHIPIIIGDIIEHFLMHPEFLYRIETKGNALKNDSAIYQRTSFEVASYLSSLIWDDLPDDRLWRLAGQSLLTSPSVVKAETTRMLYHEKARAKIRTFFNAYFKPDPAIAYPDVPRFLDGIDSERAIRSSNDELKAFIDYIAFGINGSFYDLFTSRVSFYQDANLAKLFGVPQRPKDSLFLLPESQRAGILTRPALLQHSGLYSSPVKRGVRLVQNIFCDDGRSNPGSDSG